MKYFLFIVFMTITINSLADDAENILRDFVWQKRVLLVFTPDNSHINYQRQNIILSKIAAGMDERNITTIAAMANGMLLINNNEQSQTADNFYQRYAVTEKQFRVILIGKDGKVKLDRNKPVFAEELFALIDAMPMRLYEMHQHD